MDAVQATVADWISIVRGEYSEIPGLHLIRQQMQRLWGLDPATCEALHEYVVPPWIADLLGDAVHLEVIRQLHRRHGHRVRVG